MTLRDVQTEVRVLTPGPDGWEDRPLDGVPPATSTSIIDVDPLESDDFFLNSSGFTVPATLLSGTAGGPLNAIKQAPPSFFDAENISVTQHFATSDDGTQVPYFVVGSNIGIPPSPTLLYGYGGFENSMVPAYGGGVGRAWLERGHTYVIANIRGGGEYGPTWHTQALKENRHKVFEDFAAVAKDLVARGITTAEQLGIQGGSNGGLLMGVMLTRYPSLFGGDRVPGAAAGHEALSPAACGCVVDGRVRRPPRQSGRVGLPEEVLPPLSERRPPRRDVPADPDHHLDSRRPGASRSCPQDGRPARGAGHSVRYYENIEGGHGGAADNAQAAFKSALTFTFLEEVLAR